MKILIVQTKKLGLEVYQVYVCGVMAHELLSLEGAQNKAQQYMNKLKKAA